MNTGPDPVPEEDSESSSASVDERRQNPRYKCSGSAEFRTEGIEIRTWATVTDISRGGCYVEMQATSPLDTPVDLQIEIHGIRMRAKGLVRVCYPFLGMGIAFTQLGPEDHDRLEMILSILKKNTRAPGAALAVEPEGDNIPFPGAALACVTKFFQSNQTLTREQFMELVRKSQETDPLLKH